MTNGPILAFDTSAAHCAAALLLGDRVVTRVDDMAKGQAEHLMPLLEDMLASEALNWRDLAAIGVGIGPGNFTGIRISVSAARGLALGLGIPAVGVSTLDAQTVGLDGTIVSCRDARRGMAYVQIGRDADTAKLCDITHDAIPSPNPKSEPAIVGDIAAAIADVTGWPVIAPKVSLIEGIARLAAARRYNVNLPRPAPMYLRSADAAPPRDAAPAIIP